MTEKMFEEQLERIHAKTAELNKHNERFGFNRCATSARIEEYENEIGFSLPEEYREFILQMGDGCRLVQPLFRENTTHSYWCPVPLVAFPLRQTKENRSGLCGLVRWDDLSGHEKMELDVALQFFIQSGLLLRTLVLSGVHRGEVWSSTNRVDLGPFAWEQPEGLSFLDWYEKQLDEESELNSVI